MSLDGPFSITLDSNDATFNILGDEKLRLTSLGNVGIGTTNPGAKLHIDGISPTVTGLILRNTSGVNRALEFFNSDNEYRMGFHYDNENIRLYVVDTQRNPMVTFGANGNVGIGTTSPTGGLHIKKDQDSFPTGQNQYVKDGTLVLENAADGTLSTSTDGTVAGYGSNIKFASRWKVDDADKTTVEMGAIAGYNGFYNGFGGGLTFWTHPNASTPLVERMRINHDGNVGIGTDIPSHGVSITTERVSSSNHVSGVHLGTANSGDYSQIVMSSSVGCEIDFSQGGSSVGRISYTHSDNSMRFFTNSPTSERMRISNDGRIRMISGLRVQGAYYSFDYNNQYNYYTDPAFTKYHDPGNRNFGVEVDNYLEALGILLTSDERIKTNIRDIEDDKSLQDLRLLCPKIYSYKDTFTRGDSETIGFIAQKVQQVLPRAVTTGTKSIPNILKPAIAHHKENDIFDLSFSVPIDSDITLTSDSIIELNVDGNTIEAKVVSYANGIIEITTEDTDKIKDGDKVVIYGEIVDDFHFLDKNAIFTVATAALQEVDRQLQAEKVKTATLETQLADEKTKVATLETQVADILQRLSNAGIINKNNY